ncbi:MAG TPA: tRNA (guanosine(37)-N1)-methyltransferase TrmD [Tepiditoga sp.]|nr:tRNA (guanosine(37)-N1)-methyltransferase TrmD [Tepiditoga sp.]
MKPKIKISVLTIFPEMFRTLTDFGVFKRALDNGIIEFEAVNLRDYTHDRHKITDIPGYGPGPGMVMKPEPFFEYYEEYEKKNNKKPYTVILSPQGRPFNNEISSELSKKEDILFFCGRYEGPDERVYNICDDEISVGDFVVTGGEIPAMIIIDSLSRFIPGVVGDSESVENDSFFNGLLDYSVYTKPYEYKNYKVPDILLSGNHKKIESFRKKESIIKTILKRPDLFIKKDFSSEEKKEIVEIIREMFKDA